MTAHILQTLSQVEQISLIMKHFFFSLHGNMSPCGPCVTKVGDTGELGGLDKRYPHSDKPQALMSRGCCGLSLW